MNGMDKTIIDALNDDNEMHMNFVFQKVIKR